MAVPQQQMAGQAPDMQKVFQSEKESLELTQHQWDLQDVEARLLKKLTAAAANSQQDKKRQ